MCFYSREERRGKMGGMEPNTSLIRTLKEKGGCNFLSCVDRSKGRADQRVTWSQRWTHGKKRET